ncbi:NADAR family protein [Xenorhabdus griffiniae]|uniref:NADAR family protein n=1 Tax=Xenorhabdus griffiniae TaxID=351672 RepID=UPI0030D14CFE
MKIIRFYRTNEAYGEFSNFSKHGFIDDQGLFWLTVEHYFQANKFIDKSIQENIRQLNSPMDAATAGRDRKKPLRPDWEVVKDDIMRFSVLEKFKQNLDIQNILLSTHNALIIEHTTNDFYWADGGDGSGKNMLGIILMETREILLSEEKI